MDTGQAVLLGVVLLGLIQEVKVLVWGTAKDRITVAIVNGCALAAVFLVAETVWGNEQIVGGQQLGLLDWASKLVVALVLGGVAAGGWETLTAVKNVGQVVPLSLDKVRANVRKYPDVHKGQPTETPLVGAVNVYGENSPGTHPHPPYVFEGDDSPSDA